MRRVTASSAITTFRTAWRSGQPEGMLYLWGKDLERAIRQSISMVKLGDRIGARRVAREAILPRAVVRKANGPEPPTLYRTRWMGHYVWPSPPLPSRTMVMRRSPSRSLMRRLDAVPNR